MVIHPLNGEFSIVAWLEPAASAANFTTAVYSFGECLTGAKPMRHLQPLRCFGEPLSHGPP